MYIPDGILCSKAHEWVLQENNLVLAGLTDYGVELLGDIVSVELPEVGSKFEKDEIIGAVESVKSASEIYMPVSGVIEEVNEELINSPELINEDMFSFWLIKIKPDNFFEDSQGLMDYDDYREDIQ